MAGGGGGEGHGTRRRERGGGLGIPYRGTKEAPPVPFDYGALIKRTLGHLGCEVQIEPGRLIVGNAGLLVAAVIYRKAGEGRDFLIVDAAMNDLIRPAMYDAWHDIVPVAEPVPDTPVGAVVGGGRVAGTAGHSARGPGLADVGGLAELQWSAEYADLHGSMIATHGTGDGLIGLAAQVQVAATLPKNYIAFEYPTGNPEWWYDIVEGLPNPIVKDSFIEVWDTPGLGVTLNAEAAAAYLRPEDADFFE